MSEYKNHEDPFQKAAERAIAASNEVEEEVVVEEDNASIEDIKIVPEATEEVETLEVEVETPAETNEEAEPLTKDETTLVEEPASTGDEEVSNFDEWDETTAEKVEEDAPVEFDYPSLAKDLGLEATTKEDIIKEVNAIKESSSQKDEATAGLPDNLKQAIKIAELDGDYLQYLGVTSVDYNQVDNAILVQDQLANLPSMQLPEGKGVDIEKLAEAMEGMSDLDIEMRGNEIKTHLIAQQDGFKANVQREAQVARDEADKNLRTALDGLEDVRGFKVNGTHKKTLYDAISSGQMVQDLFYGSDGKMDYNKVAKIVFDATYGDKINSFLKQRITTSTKKELLDKLSNKQIEPKAAELPNAKPDNSAQKQLANQLASGNF